MGVVTVQQQDLNQGAGAASVAVGLAGRGPERLVHVGERPCRAGLDQRGGAAQRAGLTDQHFQVVIEQQDLTASHGRAFMTGDLGPAVEQNQLRGAQHPPDAMTDQPGGNGVVALPDRDPGIPVDPRRQRQAGLEQLGR